MPLPHPPPHLPERISKLESLPAGKRGMNPVEGLSSGHGAPLQRIKRAEGVRIICDDKAVHQTLPEGRIWGSEQPHPSESIFFSLSFSVVISTSALWLRNSLSSPGPLELMMGLGRTWGEGGVGGHRQPALAPRPPTHRAWLAPPRGSAGGSAR